MRDENGLARGLAGDQACEVLERQSRRLQCDALPARTAAGIVSRTSPQCRVRHQAVRKNVRLSNQSLES